MGEEESGVGESEGQVNVGEGEDVKLGDGE